VIGYETVGSYGYIEQLKTLARQLDVRDQVTFSGPLSRYKMLPYSRQAHIGLALIPLKSNDDNMIAMIGASNKVFDYLASGLALLVSDLPSWQECYVASGYARSCNPSDPQSIASALRWYLDHPNEMRAMGERGRQRILSEWNYESQFSPVLAQLLER
jgi:glycosyltransferase involved in cell wall biosynthesis